MLNCSVCNVLYWVFFVLFFFGGGGNIGVIVVVVVFFICVYMRVFCLFYLFRPNNSLQWRKSKIKPKATVLFIKQLMNKK